MGHDARTYADRATGVGAYAAAKEEGSVALGFLSVADRKAGSIGYVPGETIADDAALATFIQKESSSGKLIGRLLVLGMQRQSVLVKLSM